MAKEKKISFLVYANWWDALKRMSETQQGLFLRALYEYQLEGKLPSDDSPISLIFWTIKGQMDDDTARYEQMVIRNQVNGKKGGRPKKPSGFENNQVVFDLTEGFFEKPKKADKIREDKIREDEDKIIEKEKEKENLTPEQKRRIEEDRRWNELYNEVHSSEMYKNSSYNKQNK